MSWTQWTSWLPGIRPACGCRLKLATLAMSAGAPGRNSGCRAGPRTGSGQSWTTGSSHPSGRPATAQPTLSAGLLKKALLPGSASFTKRQETVLTAGTSDRPTPTHRAVMLSWQLSAAVAALRIPARSAYCQVGSSAGPPGSRRPPRARRHTDQQRRDSFRGADAVHARPQGVPRQPRRSPQLSPTWRRTTPGTSTAPFSP